MTPAHWILISVICLCVGVMVLIVVTGGGFKK